MYASIIYVIYEVLYCVYREKIKITVKELSCFKKNSFATPRAVVEAARSVEKFAWRFWLRSSCNSFATRHWCALSKNYANPYTKAALVRDRNAGIKYKVSSFLKNVFRIYVRWHNDNIDNTTQNPGSSTTKDTSGFQKVTGVYNESV